jgi:hypothetical protein
MIQRYSGGEFNNDGQMEESSIRKSNRHGGTACESCGNEYDKAIEIVVNGISHYFDCFECAIHMLAPKCSHCGCKIIGHGVEAGGSFYCCAHCAEKQGVHEMVDRA